MYKFLTHINIPPLVIFYFPFHRDEIKYDIEYIEDEIFTDNTYENITDGKANKYGFSLTNL